MLLTCTASTAAGCEHEAADTVCLPCACFSVFHSTASFTCPYTSDVLTAVPETSSAAPSTAAVLTGAAAAQVKHCVDSAYYLQLGLVTVTRLAAVSNRRVEPQNELH